MKLSACILSLYIFLLTACPCADLVSDQFIQKTSLSHHSKDSHESGCDMCSPFCTCNCCVSPIL